jgi:hypothetical protein
MTLHFAMPLHLLGFLAVSMGPLEVLTELRSVFIAPPTESTNRGKRKSNLNGSHLSWRGIATFVLATAAVTPVLYFGCMSHPFLLADNRYISSDVLQAHSCCDLRSMYCRHYTFYVWRYLLSKPALRSVSMKYTQYMYCIEVGCV